MICLLILLVLAIHPTTPTTPISPTSVTCELGHYRPRGSCHFRNAVVLPDATIQSTPFELSPSARSVVDLWNVHISDSVAYTSTTTPAATTGDTDSTTTISSTTTTTTATTTTTTTTFSSEPKTSKCTQIRGPVIAFTFYYHYGHGNYYHFVYDTLIPLIALLEQKQQTQKQTGAETDHATWLMHSHTDAQLWPTVEHGNLPGKQPGVDWDTNAFSSSSSSSTGNIQLQSLPYWHSSLLQLFPNFLLRPMTRAHWPLQSKSLSTPALCIHDLILGLPKVEHSSPEVVERYVGHVRHLLKLVPPPLLPSHSAAALAQRSFPCAMLRCGFVRRSNRRRVINWKELAGIMQQDMPVDILRMEKMTMRDQLDSMQKYSILVGMQGAGLINGLFLPKAAHAVVLFQYNAASDSFAELLRPRLTSYKRWINHNESNSRNDRDKDPFHDIADTIVDTAEFRLLWNGEVSALQQECSNSSRRKKIEL